MNAELRKNEEILRAFMRNHYTDERLSMLLAHAQAGKLSYLSCCCFVGVTTAGHALVGGEDEAAGAWAAHGRLYSSVCCGISASNAYSRLSSGYSTMDLDVDEIRRRRIFPMIRAEMKRRAMLPESMLPESILEAQEVFA